MKLIRAFVACLVALLILACDGPSEPVSPLVGKSAPDFRMRPLGQDKDVQLSSFKGKVVLIDFWATWCGPCIALMPAIAEIQNRYRADGFVVLGVSDESETDLNKFIEKQGEPGYAILRDIEGGGWAQYGVSTMPMTVLIDREGKVARVERGASSDLNTQPLENAVRQALGKA